MHSSFVIGRFMLCSVILYALIFIMYPWMTKNTEILNIFSQNAIKYIQFEEISTTRLSKAEINHLLHDHNREANILNLDKFGPIKNDTTVIVFQIRRFSQSFKYVLASLCDLNGIQEALIIFSHLHFDVNMNRLIQSIEFCRVLQIFYPYSLQIFTDISAGHIKNDYLYDTSIEKVNYTGAFTPGVGRIYRESIKNEKKHFWWWTANKIFSYLTISKGFNGVVMFLEDDLILIQDFFYMLIYMTNIAKTLPQCEFISLGSVMNNYDNAYSIDLTSWDPKLHTSAIAFDVAVWKIILKNHELFCNVDDNSWSRSLLYLSLNQKHNQRFKVLHSQIPRAIKIPVCSYSFFRRCNEIDNIIEILSKYNKIKTTLYPPYVEIYTNIEIEDDEYVIFEGLGGWNHPNDIALCRDIMFN